MLRDLKHLVNGLRSNCEHNFTSGRRNDSLVWKITRLAFKDDLRERVGLRKHVEG